MAKKYALPFYFLKFIPVSVSVVLLLGSIGLTVFYPCIVVANAANEHLSKIEEYYDREEYDSALNYALQAEIIFRNNDDWESWYACYRWGTILYAENTNKFEDAINWLQLGLETAQKNQLDFFIVGKIHGLFGYIYDYNGKTDKALLAYLKSLEWREKSGNLEGIESVYNNLGMLYIIRGEYPKAFEYLHRSLKINLENENDDEISYVCFHLGITYSLVNLPDSALFYYDKAIDCLGAEDSPTLARKAEVLTYQEQWEDAQNWAQKALKIASDAADSAFAYKKLADIYTKTDRLDRAIGHYKEAIDLNGLHDRERAKNHIGIGEILFQQKSHNQAIGYYKNALQCFEKKSIEVEGIFNAVNQDDFPPDIWYCIALDKMGDVLHEKAMFQKEQNKPYLDTLKLSLQFYERAIFNAQSVRISYIEEDAKLEWRTDNQQIFEKAIGIAYELSKQDKQYQETAFSLIERSKAAVLLESIQEQEALQFAEIPDSLSQQLATLKNTIAALTYQKGHNTSSRQSLQDSIFNTKRQLERLLKKTAETYPTYKDWQQDLELTLLAEVQKSLVDADTQLLEFFMGEDKGYVASVGARGSRIFEIADMGLVRSHIEALHKSLSSKKMVLDSPQLVYQPFVESAHWLYENLLTKALGGVEGTQLIVVPDGHLGFVPFEVLLTSMPNTSKRRYKKLPYLLKKYSVSYAYSTTLLKKKSKEKKLPSTEPSIAAFAPFAEGSDSMPQNLPPLPNSKTELEALSQILKGRFYYGQEASESAVKQACREAAMLHFSTHTLIDNAHPMYSVMIFADSKEDSDNDGKLYAYELYNMQIEAEMAVLSACETGYGKLSRGEGILSLSRAFVHAGCPSTVMSLWQIDDKASATLMGNFYNHLKNNLPKNEALRQAKLEYLQNTETAYAHPYYWAALVSTGNSRALNFENSYSSSSSSSSFSMFGWSLLGGVLVICVLIGVIRKW